MIFNILIVSSTNAGVKMFYREVSEPFENIFIMVKK